MDEDKSIAPGSLPVPRQNTDTKQAEEYVDKSSVRKDENDVPAKTFDTSDDGPRDRAQ